MTLPESRWRQAAETQPEISATSGRFAKVRRRRCAFVFSYLNALFVNSIHGVIKGTAASCCGGNEADKRTREDKDERQTKAALLLFQCHGSLFDMYGSIRALPRISHASDFLFFYLLK